MGMFHTESFSHRLGEDVGIGLMRFNGFGVVGHDTLIEE